MAKKLMLYTFGEVVKELRISSNQLNELISAGKLKPVRHKGRLKFRKENLEQIKKERAEKLAAAMKALKEQGEKKFYTLEEVLCELQVDKDELKGLIDTDEIQAYEGKDGLKFNKKEIEKFKMVQQSKATMIVTPSMQKNLSVGLDDFASIFQEKAEPKETPEEYYKFDQVLAILQMEPRELERMVEDGDLMIINSPEGVKYKKSEIELLRQERMIEATVVVQPENIIEEDEEIVPILISANSEADLEAIQPEEFYTFDEAAYELQLELSELKRMVARQEIDVIKEKDGFKFRKADIDGRHHNIEPTIILPEEPETDEEEEETIPLPAEVEDKKPVHTLEKSFCSIPKAAKYLKVSEEKLQRWIKEKLLRAYMVQGKKRLRVQDVRKFKEQRKARAKVKSTAIEKKPPTAQDFYSMEETIKLLQIDEKKLKIIVARGKLEVTRCGKEYRFLKSSVDDFSRKKTEERKPPKKIETDIPLPEKTGEKPTREKQEPEMTMVLPLTDDEEDEKPAVLKAPKSKKPRPVQIAEDTMMLPLDPPEKPKRPQVLSVEELEAKLRESDRQRDALSKEYYTQPQALMALSIELKELEELVEQGTLTTKKLNDRIYFNREEIDELQKGKMIEPTVMVGDEEGDDLLDDDEDDIFFLK